MLLFVTSERSSFKREVTAAVCRAVEGLVKSDPPNGPSPAGRDDDIRVPLCVSVFGFVVAGAVYREELVMLGKAYDSNQLFTHVRGAVKRAERNARALFTTLSLFHPVDSTEEKILLSERRTFVRFVILDCVGRLELEMKYQCAAVFSKAVSRSHVDWEPSCPPPPDRLEYSSLTCGFWKCWLARQWSRTLSQRRLSLAYSILQLKRGCAPLRVREVAKTLQGHREALTSPPAPLSSDVARIARLVARAALGRRGTMWDDLERVSPFSLNAHWGSGRSVGGAYGALQRYKPAEERRMVDLWNLHGLPDDVFRLELPIEGATVQQSIMNAACHTCTELNDDELFNYFLKAPEGAHVPHGVLYAKVVALQEPFKCRVISLSEAECYAVSLSFQKWAHPVLKSLPVFQHIGRPLLDADAESFMEKVDWDEVVVSGDYSAATDRLNGHLSAVLLDETINCWSWWNREAACPSEIRAMLHKSLLGHFLSYTDTLKQFVKDDPGAAAFQEFEEIQDGLQRNGQLMGSPLSFIILCLANAVTLVAAMVRLGVPVREAIEKVLFSGRVLVNGDDILFSGKEALVREWKRVASHCGLSPSVGKNYVSRDFFCMNSQLYLVRDLAWSPVRQVTRVGFTNLSLILGGNVKKSSSGGDTRPLWATAAEVSEKIRVGLKPDVANRALLSFLAVRGCELRSCPKGMNWFYPRELGGLGIRPVPGWTMRTTPLQAKVARALTLPQNAIDNTRARIWPVESELPYYAEASLRTLSKMKDWISVTREVVPMSTFDARSEEWEEWKDETFISLLSYYARSKRQFESVYSHPAAQEAQELRRFNRAWKTYVKLAGHKLDGLDVEQAWRWVSRWKVVERASVDVSELPTLSPLRSLLSRDGLHDFNTGERLRDQMRDGRLVLDCRDPMIRLRMEAAVLVQVQ